MNQARLSEWKRLAGALAVSFTLAGCGAAAPAAGGVTATAWPDNTGPHLSLSPASGALNTQLTLDGAGFPVSTRVRITLGTSGTSREPQFIGEVLSNEGGIFKLIFIVPGTWPDGTPITERRLIFNAVTLDGATSTTADFTNAAATANADDATVASTASAATPAVLKPPAIALSPASGGVNTPVSVSARDFAPNTRIGIRLGVPGAGAGPQVYANAVTDQQGSATLSFAIPTTWPDGKPVAEKVVVVVVSSDDGRARALAEFNLGGTPPDPNGTLTTPTAMSGTAPVAATPGATLSAPPTSVTASAPLPVDGTAPAAPDPIQASIAFMYALLRDPSGASSVVYLSQRLRAEISNNWALPTGLGVQPGYNSFEVVMLSKAEDNVVIQATLTYESGASVRNFTLIKEGDNWRIDKVVAGSR
jgi:hypothetical protein